MADYKNGLPAIPTHMWIAVAEWVEKGEPHPSAMGGFFQGVLCNDLVEAACHADHANAQALKQWALFLYNDMPSPAWGSMKKLLEWYEKHHPKKEDEDEV